MKLLNYSPWLFAILVLLLSNQVYAEPDLLRIHGSNTVGAALVPEITRQWLKSNGYSIISERTTAAEERLIEASKNDGNKLTIEIHAHGSSTAFQDLAAGKADIGMSSRPIKASEVDKLAPLGQMNKSNTEFIIAIDGLAIIVNPQNPLKQISKDKLQKIFSGQISNWSQFGLSPGRIHVYARDDKSGTYDTFKSLVLGKKTPLIKTARRYESNAKLSDDVAADPLGIGFVGLAYIRKSQALAISEEGAMALYPSKFNVATEDYALSRRLYLYVPEQDRHPLAESFSRFAKSDAGQKIAARVGFVSQEVISFVKPIHEEAPAEYKKLVQDAKRLSLNIRFHEGRSNMDNKAIHDVSRLVKYMRIPENEGKRLMLFGFSDSNESLPHYSLTLSIDRADSVADKLLSYNLAPDRVRGYGPEIPVSSNDGELGRVRNRRVEVWVHDSNWQ